MKRGLTCRIDIWAQSAFKKKPTWKLLFSITLVLKEKYSKNGKYCIFLWSFKVSSCSFYQENICFHEFEP